MVMVLADPALHEFIGGEPASLEELRERYASWTRGSGSDHETWLNWIVRHRTRRCADRCRAGHGRGLREFSDRIRGLDDRYFVAATGLCRRGSDCSCALARLARCGVDRRPCPSRSRGLGRSRGAGRSAANRRDHRWRSRVEDRLELGTGCVTVADRAAGRSAKRTVAEYGEPGGDACVRTDPCGNDATRPPPGGATTLRRRRPAAGVRRALRAVLWLLDRPHQRGRAVDRWRAELRSKSVDPGVRTDRGGFERAGIVPRPSVRRAHGRVLQPGSRRRGVRLGSVRAAGRHADRPVADVVRLRRPSHPASTRHRRDRLADTRVRRLGGARCASRCRCHRTARQSRRRAAVVPVAAHQPSHRRLRRQRRESSPTRPRDRRAHPTHGRPPDHARSAVVSRRDDRRRLRHR